MNIPFEKHKIKNIEWSEKKPSSFLKRLSAPREMILTVVAIPEIDIIDTLSDEIHEQTGMIPAAFSHTKIS